MSLWQSDWKQIAIDGQKKWLVSFMDDSSRLITNRGVFDSPTTENTILVLEMGFARYGIPWEILTDHGTQFVSARERDVAYHTFKEFLGGHGIKFTSAVSSIIKQLARLNGYLEKRRGELTSSGQLMRLSSGIMRSNLIRISIMMSLTMHSGIVFPQSESSGMLRGGSISKYNSGYHNFIIINI